ncbi:MAG TPA: lysophospholipid acyltransferase family protein [Polyangiales bacterium]|nr:lysophospholipid acyltransferase family protein [Polyangiales bacterium]
MVTFAISSSVVLRDPNFFRRMQRHWARGLTSFWGVELEVFGAENMPVGGSYVVMSNHASYADIVALFIALPVIPGFLAKRELMRVPFLAAALRAGGHVLIDRKRRGTARAALESAAMQVRNEGKTVLIFPEGTRSPADTIDQFKSGGFHLAKSAGVPIIPVGLRGTGAIAPRNSILVYPGKIEVHIGAPITPTEIASRQMNELVNEVRYRITSLGALTPREAGRGEPAPA